MHHLRCVLVGDPCVGKTALIVSYTRNGFCERYSPTAFDNYSVTVCVDGNPLRLELCDTAGRSEFDSLRPLSYAGASVFLLCFSVARPSSLGSVTQRWLPQIRSLAPSVPVLLVGTQSDRRLVSHRPADTVDPRAMAHMAERLQLSWLECSAVTQHNLKEVFDLAILRGLCHDHQQRIVPGPTQQPRIVQQERVVVKQHNGKMEPYPQHNHHQRLYNNHQVPNHHHQARDRHGHGHEGPPGAGKGSQLKQNFWKLVSITKKALM